MMIMRHYQEEGIGIKGFTSDRGSILKDNPITPRVLPDGLRGTPVGCSRSHEEIPRPMMKLEGVAVLLRDRFQNVPHFCPEQLGVRNFK